MKRSHFLVCLLSFCLLFSFFPTGAVAEEKGEKEKEAAILSEILELRETNSETFLLDDGTFQCVVYAADKYYYDEDGFLAKIDNTIVEKECIIDGVTYSYQNKASATPMMFGEKDDVAVRIELGGDAFTMQPVDAYPVPATIGKTEHNNAFEDYYSNQSNLICYDSIYDNTDLIYVVGITGLKEYMVLKDKSAPSTFQYRVSVSDDFTVETEDSAICFYNKDGEESFSFDPLYAVDSEGKYTDQISYELDSVENGVVSITVRLEDEQYFQSEAVYPVLLDPTITISSYSQIYDACVCSRYPSTNYSSNSFLRTGRDSDYYVRRSFIQFVLPASVNGASIASAYMDLYCMSGVAPTISAYRVNSSWTSSSITWNNMPSYSSSSGSFNQQSGGWYRAFITSLVQNWANGNYNNYGVLVRDSTETGTSHWSTYYSSEAGNSYLPKLVINYHTSLSVNVPYYAQLTNATCGAACLRMVFAYYNVNLSEAQVIEYAKNVTGSATGYKNQTAHYQILNTYQSSTTYSYHSFTSGSLSTDEFAAKTANNLYYSRPYIILVNIPSGNGYFPYSSNGHFLVVKAISNVDYITVNDPYMKYLNSSYSSTVTMPASFLRDRALGTTGNGEVTTVYW